MIGIIIELIISWLLLWFIDKKHLSVLGFKPTRPRLLNLLVGILLAASTCASFHLLTTILGNDKWMPNKHFTLQKALSGIWWTLKSVLFEELIFRGALLYLAIRKLGSKTACVLSAVCFGFYHWFSFNAFGNPVQMIFIFVMTAIFGLALAVAFSKTKSLYLPVGLHLGWNLVNIVAFSNGPIGQQLLIRSNEGPPLEGVSSLIIFLFQVFTLPLLTFWYLKGYPKNQKSVAERWN